MDVLRMTLQRIPFGWAVVLTDGRVLGRFVGWHARERALQFAGATA